MDQDAQTQGRARTHSRRRTRFTHADRPPVQLSRKDAYVKIALQHLDLAHGHDAKACQATGYFEHNMRLAAMHRCEAFRVSAIAHGDEA